MSIVYFDPAIGGDGSTVTDDSNPSTGLASGGHRTRFVPALAQMVAVCEYAVDHIGAPAVLPFTKADGSTDDILLNAAGAVTSLSGTDLLDFTKAGLITIDGSAGWRDITGEITVRGTGGNNPTWAAYVNGIYAYQFSATVMNECWLTFHINHDYKIGSAIYFHTHWSVLGTNTGVVRWGFEYTIAKGHNQSNFPATTTVYVEQAAQGTTQRHQISETIAISSAELEVDSLILVRVFRDAAHGNDTQTAGAFLLTADIHYQADRFATYNKAPNFYTL